MPNSLSDMEFDEVSFVRKGANPEAKIVFWKSEDGPEEPIAEGTEDHQWALMQRRATWLMDEDPDLTRPEAIAKTLDEHPELYDPQQASCWGWRRQTPTTVSGGTCSWTWDRLADQIQVANFNLTRAQAVAKAVSMRPEVYDKAVLMSAEGPMQQQSAR